MSEVPLEGRRLRTEEGGVAETVVRRVCVRVQIGRFCEYNKPSRETPTARGWDALCNTFRAQR